ncbi:MAG: hypothetical protein QHJ82_14865, partial [Verrucomicrobiota bacterium]|nr:hypothetical protein [Verrucomicrobiota bacterium]
AQTALILDPPRVGCDARVLNQIRAARPVQVLYVSCNPATMARDLNTLCAGGLYKVMRVQPLDMFPQTQHMECVADVRLQAAVGGAVTGRDTEATCQESDQTGLAKTP